MICQDTIDLLRRNVSVETPETSLNVRDRRILLCPTITPCERRIQYRHRGVTFGSTSSTTDSILNPSLPFVAHAIWT